jgi:hypothetical protein
MNLYKAILTKGSETSKFDMLKETIFEAARFAEKIGRENDCDKIEVMLDNPNGDKCGIFKLLK